MATGGGVRICRTARQHINGSFLHALQLAWRGTDCSLRSIVLPAPTRKQLLSQQKLTSTNWPPQLPLPLLSLLDFLTLALHLAQNGTYRIHVSRQPHISWDCAACSQSAHSPKVTHVASIATSSGLRQPLPYPVFLAAFLWLSLRLWSSERQLWVRRSKTLLQASFAVICCRILLVYVNLTSALKVLGCQGL